MPERQRKWRALRVRKEYERHGEWRFREKDKTKKLREEANETIADFRAIYGNKKVKRLIDG